MGVKTIMLTENKGQLAGALVVREHQELVFISQNGMVQRTSVRGINRYGRASQGVRVMNIRDDDQVSAVALVVESEAQTAAQVIGDNGDNGAAPVAEEPTALTDDAPAPADDPAGPADDAPAAGDDEAAPDSE
jgi:DNA gyrase subunit A